jgi:uncharacterized protein
MTSNVRLRLLPHDLAVVRLAPEAELPGTVLGGPFVSITRTGDELSVVCADRDAPSGGTVERGWSCLQVVGPLDLSLTGVLASLAKPLADAEVSVLVISTYDTDHLLVRSELLRAAVAALERAGHTVSYGQRAL